MDVEAISQPQTSEERKGSRRPLVVPLGGEGHAKKNLPRDFRDGSGMNIEVNQCGGEREQAAEGEGEEEEGNSALW